MSKTATAKSSSFRKHEGRLLCLCLTAACLSAPLNGLSPSLTLVALEFGFNSNERDIYLGETNSYSLNSALNVVKLRLLLYESRLTEIREAV